MPDIDIILKGTDRASGAIKDVNRELGKLDDHSKGLGGALGTLSHALGTGLVIAATAALAAISALGVGLGKSITAAANMEQGVADIMAVFGKAAPPVEELNKLIQDLALDPKLKVNATQAAQAINMLSKNGITWEQISGGMARSTVLLANATNDDFAQAADIATDIMVNFNKSGKDMEDVMDGIIGVTQQSKLDLNGYALASGQASGVAGAYGVELEDFNAVLAATSSAFTGGSDAGTSFKVFLQRMVPDTGKAKDAMRDLGLLTEEGGNAFFDANGNMESMTTIAGELARATAGLSDEQRILAFTNIFGTDAQRTANALALVGAEGIERTKKLIADTSAEDAAATRMDTLIGSWEIFKGVVEALSIQLGTVFLPVVREVVDWLTKMAIEHGPKVVEWATKLAAVMGSDLPLAFEDGSGKIMQFLEVLGLSEGVAQAVGKAFAIISDVISGNLSLAYEDGSGAIKQFLEALGVSEGVAQSVGVAFDILENTLTSVYEVFRLLITGDFRGGIFGLNEDDPFINALFIARDAVTSVWEIVRLFITRDFRGGIFGLNEDDPFINALFVIRDTFTSGFEIVRLFITRDFRGGIFGLREDDPFINALFEIRDLFTSTWEIARLLVTGDFRGGIFGLNEDDPVINALFMVRDGALAVFNGVKDLLGTGSDFVTKFVSWKDVAIAVGIALAATFGPPIIAAIAGFVAAVAPIALLMAGLVVAVSLLRNAWEKNWGGIKTKTLEVMDYIGGRFGPLGTTIKTFGVDALKEIAAWATGTETEFTATNTIIDEAKKTFGLLWDDFAKRFPETATVVNNAWIKVSGATKTAWEYVTEKSAGLVTAITTFGTDSLKEIVEWAKGNKTEFTATTKIWEAFGETVVEVGNDINESFFGPDGAGTKMAKWLLKEFPAASAASVFSSNELKAAFTNLATATGTSFSLTKNQADSFMMALQDVIGKSLAVIITRMTVFVSNFGDMIKVMDKAGQADWGGMWEAIKNIQERSNRSLLFEAAVWAGDMESAFILAGEGSISGFGKGIDARAQFGVGKVRGFGDAVKNDFADNLELNSPSAVFDRYGTNTIQGFINGVDGMLGATSTKMGEVIMAVKSLFADPINWLYQKGVDAVQGFINGLGSMIGAAQAKVTELGNLAAQALGLTLESDSPSKVFHRHGEWAGQGFINGMQSKLGVAQQMAAQLAQVASQAVQSVTGKVQASDGTWVLPSFYTTPATGKIPIISDFAKLFAASEANYLKYKDEILDAGEFLGKAGVAYSATLVDSVNKAMLQKYATGSATVASDFAKLFAASEAHYLKYKDEILDAAEFLGKAGVGYSAALVDSVNKAMLQKYATGSAAVAGKVQASDGTWVPPSFYTAPATGKIPITNIEDAAQVVLQHFYDAGEILLSSAKSFNIASSIESAVDALVMSKWNDAKSTGKVLAEDGTYVNKNFYAAPVTAPTAAMTYAQQSTALYEAMLKNLGIHSPSAKFAWLGEMSAKGFKQGFERGMSNTPTSINNSRADNRQFVVNVNSTGDAVRDIRNQVELYALTFGVT